MSSASHDVRASIEARIHERDREGAVTAALEAIRDNAISVPELYDELASLLIAIGGGWQSGDVEVWEEHFASGVVRTIVESAHDLVTERAATSNGLTVVLATPPDEYHDIGLRMTADRFTLAGWTTHFIGANVPVEQLIEAVRALGADAAVVSTSTHFHRLGLHAYVDELRTAVPGLRVWVGGAAFASDTHDWPNTDVLRCEDIATLAQTLRPRAGEAG